MTSRLACTSLGFGYRRGRAVLRDLTLELPPGRTLLLGPNGAGKSTLLNLLAGTLRPQRGSVEAEGRVGLLPQHVRPVRGMTVTEHLAYAGWLRGMSAREARAAARDRLVLVGLEAMADRPSRDLSGGEVRRLGIAESILEDADTILLDEPTAGLDITERARFRETLAGLQVARVVVSTHQIDHLGDVFDHVLVLQQGAVLFQGRTDEFLSLAPPDPDADAEAAYLRLVGQAS